MTLVKQLSFFSSDISTVQELNTGLPCSGPWFKSWAGLRACLLASSRWEPTLLSRPSPREPRLGYKLTSFCPFWKPKVFGSMVCLFASRILSALCVWWKHDVFTCQLPFNSTVRLVATLCYMLNIYLVMFPPHSYVYLLPPTHPPLYTPCALW